jgi:peptide/nickel transport system substrate-binding protein
LPVLLLSAVRRARRPKNRRLSALACGVVLPVLLTAACHSSSGSSAHPSDAPSPVNGGTLTYATDQLPDCLDPAFSPRDVVGVIDRQIFDSLVAAGPDGTFKPWLATSWKISPDRTTYTFTLRTGVTFQDGTPLNAAAVKTSLDHVVAKATHSEYAASLLGPYTGATVVNPTTVALHLSAPFEPLLQALSTPYLGIQSPKSLTGAAESTLCGHPVGTGPFSFVSWTKPTSIALKKNPAYKWAPRGAANSGAARLNAVTVQFATKDASRFGSLTSNQSDVIDNVPPSDVSALKADKNLGLISKQQPGAVYAIGLNTAKGPLSDVRVRQALLRAVNLDELVKSVFFGQYARAWSLLSPTTTDYDASLQKSWTYDPAAANKLLDQAGWTGRDSSGYRTKDGKSLVLRWPSSGPLQGRATLAQGIQAEAKKVGIHIDYVNEDTGKYTNDLIAVNLDLIDSSFVRNEPDILRHFYESKQTVFNGGANVFKLHVPQLDKWLDGAAASDDAAVRKQDYTRAQQYIVRNALALPVYVPTVLLGHRATVHGITLDPTGIPLFQGVWKAR